MRSAVIINILLLGIIFSQMSCKKWLDVSPKTQVRERVLLTTEQGFKDALTGIYLYLGKASLYGQNMTMGFMDALAQRYTVSSTTHVFYQAGRYNYIDNNTKTTISAIWADMYTAIANANNILTQIDPQKKVFLDNNYNQVKGESLAIRAYIHFDLLRMFGTSPVVDANRKSIPYVTSFGVNVYPLLTVNQVMDSCLRDLSLAEQLLGSDKEVRTQYNTDPFLSYTRNHLNFWAVKGLQARIYLYRGDKVNALAAAQAVINNQTGRFPFVSTSAASQTTNRDRLYSSEHLFALYVTKLKDYTEAYTKTSTVNGTPTLVMSSSNLNALFETSSGGSSDIRFNNQFVLYSTSYGTSKYWQDDITLNNVNFDYLRGLVPMLRISEMYYIAAESASTPSEGVAYLNTVRAARGLTALPAIINATTLQTEILKEYKKEFYAEGQLFYYFKRMNAPKIDLSTINMTEATYSFPLPDNEVEFANRF